MSRVDFYQLSDAGNPEHFTCDLAGKIHRQQLELYILADSREHADKLDELMWTFNDISFLPHSMIDANGADKQSITIGWDNLPAKSKEVLINLSSGIPEMATDFERVVEIVAPLEADKQQARDRYKQYKQNGYELHYHDLK
jgi:DNA polymerase-3 subunit chi